LVDTYTTCSETNAHQKGAPEASDELQINIVSLLRDDDEDDCETRPGINIKTITGKIFPVEVKQGSRVQDLKDTIHAIAGIQPYQQRLLFAGHNLEYG
jgi:hypothetical protein